MFLRTHIRHPLTDLTLFVTFDKKAKAVLKGVMFGIHEKWHGRQSRLDAGLSSLGALRSAMEQFLDGKTRSLGGITLDLGGFTAFQRRVLRAARSIKWGSVVSYSDLARMSGNAKAVRAVASVMRSNDFPLVVPCHRVVKKDGSIGGFMGKTTGKCVALKKKLLERETSNLYPLSLNKERGG